MSAAATRKATAVATNATVHVDGPHAPEQIWEWDILFSIDVLTALSSMSCDNVKASIQSFLTAKYTGVQPDVPLVRYCLLESPGVVLLRVAYSSREDFYVKSSGKSSGSEISSKALLFEATMREAFQALGIVLNTREVT
jgi:hypothetical protein